jgi:triacylglycerol lipase
MVVSTLPIKQQALLFAQISTTSYLAPDEADLKYNEMGFSSVFLDHGGTQAYILTSDDDLVIVARGTEIAEWDDIEHDFDIDLIPFPGGGGEVHNGFLLALDEVWPEIVTAIARAGERKVWFTGHSLGAAVATIGAMYCVTSRLKVADVSLFAFGSPKIGDRDLMETYGRLGIPTMRFINDNDVIPRLPPYPYRQIQSGQLVYMNHWGNVRDLTPYQRAKDRFRGWIKGFSKGQFDPVIDHRARNYTANIQRWADGVEVPQKGL